MPYYAYKGVDITGKTKRGKLFAGSIEELDTLLFKRQIALLHAKPATHYFKRGINLGLVGQFFKQLSVMVEAGVELPHALAIVANQIQNPAMQEVVYEITQRVQQGKSLSEALLEYPNLFTHIMVQLVQAGEEAGKLGKTLAGICDHIQATSDFYSRLRTALMLPLITIGFFIIIVLTIFLVVMPRFVDVFTTMNQPVPPTTKALLAISTFMASTSMIWLIAVIVMGLYLGYKWSQTASGKSIMDRLVLRIPLIGSLLRQRFLAYTFQSLAFLLEGGIPIYEALAVVRSSLSNQVFIDLAAQLELEICAGNRLSSALLQAGERYFPPPMVALVEVGEESGALAPLLERAAQTYRSQVGTTLSFITLILQPFLMIILGLLVGVLIFSVYGPIFNMAHAF